MTWLWDAIAGCSAPHMTLWSALAIAFGSFFEDVLRGALSLVNAVLNLTILNTGGSSIVLQLLQATPLHGGGIQFNSVFLVMDAVGLAIAAAGIVWGAIQLNAGNLLGTRRDEARQLVGRAALAVMWMVAAPLAISLLLGLNNGIVVEFTRLNNAHGLQGLVSAQVSSSCQATGLGALSGAVGTAGLTALITTAIYMLAGDFLTLLLIAAVVIAVGQYLLRLFQIIFWGALLPIAAGASVADPQRRAWTYVWGQVTGAVFTQAAMAVGIFLTEEIMMGSFQIGGANAGHGVGNGLLMFGVGIAGFFLVGRIPRYFQELQGHSVGGGSEMGAIAGGYIMGRLGSQALQSTRFGTLMQGGLAAESAQHSAELGNPTPSFWRNPIRSVASTVYRGHQASAAAASGVLQRQDAQVRGSVGAMDSAVAAETAAKISTADAQGRNPAALDVNAATNPRNDVTPQPPTRGPGTALVDAPGRPMGAGPGPTPPSTPGSGDPLAGLGVDAGVLAGGVAASRAAGPPTAPADPSFDGIVPPPDAFSDPTVSGGAPAAPPTSAGGTPPAPGRPLFGPGSSLATGPGVTPRSGADFAAAMAPLAVSYLRGQVVPTQAAAQGGRAADFMRAVNQPLPTTPEQVAADQQATAQQLQATPAFSPARRTLERAQALRHWEQQFAINPEAGIAQLFQIDPAALNDPTQQAQIEDHLRSALTQQPNAQSKLGALLRAQTTTDPGWPTPPT